MPAVTALGGAVTAATITKSVAAADLTADAVLATLAVPGDATILDVVLTVTDMDSGAAGLVDVGDTDDDNRFVAAFSIQAAGSVRLSDTDATAVHTYSATGEQNIEVTVNTAPATAVAGTITLTVLYFRNG